MSYTNKRKGSSTGSPNERSVERLATAANGDLHLLVTFETQDADKRADGGTVRDAEFLVSDADGDGADRATDSTDVGTLADCEPYVDSVMRPDDSSDEYTETAFDEAVDVESLVSYLGLDFVEHQLFADRFRLDEDIAYTSRGVGKYQLLCVYDAGRGLLLVLDDDEAIRPLVGQARSLLTEV